MTEINLENCISSKSAEQFTTPIATSLGVSVGHTLSVAWEIAFGGLDSKLEKKKYQRQKDLECFKKELDNKINKIPHENIIDAELHIVGPTLEASKYYFEKKDLRNMFSSLIASSVDKNKVDFVHPSFSEIIKQLSLKDAENLIFFSKDFDNGFGKKTFPIANYILLESSNSVPLFNHVLDTQINILNNQNELNKYSASLINLQRLGLIDIEYNVWLTDFDYKKFTSEENFHYNTFKKQIEETFKEQIVTGNYKLTITKGVLSITEFGVNFINTCIVD